MATSLKHVQESQSGEATTVPSSFQFPTLANTNTGTVVPVAYVIFRLVKKKQKKLSLDGICHNVPNPKKNGTPETIRLIRGAHSIWSGDLVEFLKDKEYVNKNRLSLRFLDGILRVPAHEVRTLEFARANLNNVGKNRGGNGKYDYYEYDAAEEQSYRYEKQMNKINTVLKVRDMEVEPMKKLAWFLGITPHDELGMLKGDEGMRTELMLKADTQPDTVNKFIGSPEVEVAFRVKRAILDAKIDLTGQNGNAIWAGGKGFISKIPAHRKPYEYLTELAMTNSSEGKTFKEQLEQMT